MGRGDFGRIGVQLQIVGERLCEAVDLGAADRVLDVAAGNGNASLAAARHFADVTSTDYVPALLEQGRLRAEADQLPMTFQVADAEALPFDDASFDVVLSTFGVMFAPDQERAAAELVRVARRGGRIGLASWTPEGFIGQLFDLMRGFVPPPPGLRSPMEWGMETRLVELLGAQRHRHPHAAAAVHVPLSLGRALGRVLPLVLRADSQGLRRPRRGGPAIAPRRPPRPRRPLPPRATGAACAFPASTSKRW